MIPFNYFPIINFMTTAPTRNGLPVSVPLYIGMFFIAMAMLMLEIVLVRLFSVTLWYHFAFVSISLALFGISLAATFVFKSDGFFTRENLVKRLSQFSVGFACSALIGLLIHLYFPTDGLLGPYRAFASMLLNYVALCLPFFFGGVCICLLLTRFSASVGKMYACDLIGGAAGALTTSLLFVITDGPGAVVAISCICAFAGVVFSFAQHESRIRYLTAIILVGFIAIFIMHSRVNNYYDSIFRIRRLKGHDAIRPVFEDWNTYSRIAVYEVSNLPFGWGMSSTYYRSNGPEGFDLLIDEAAGTSILPAPSKDENLDFLKYDITNLAHHLQKGGHVAVIGVGGGRDIRSALEFGREKITAIEINQAIVQALRGRFLEFTGGLANDSRVNIINQEGRSYLTRATESFDLLQISLIDTWAATSAGAFTLSESALYTKEAWDLFLRKLNHGGFLSVSRWYFGRVPGETLRILDLAYSSLRNRGVRSPRDHILLARNFPKKSESDVDMGIATLLVSPDPISSETLQSFEMICNELNYEMILTPNYSTSQLAEKLVVPATHDETIANYPLNISAPDDDRPFFFFLLKLWDAITLKSINLGMGTRNIQAMQILALLLLMTSVLSYLVIVLPIRRTMKKLRSRVTIESSLFFISIGLGYLAIEISEMQKLNLYLGHPSFSLIVVLCTFLTASGLGSLFVKAVSIDQLRRVFKIVSIGLLGVMIAGGFFTDSILQATLYMSITFRIFLTVVILFPLAFLMGMPLPFGLETLRQTGREALQPWYWSLNGAMSVVSTVVVTMISINLGIMASYCFGIVCYGVAVFCLLRELSRGGALSKQSLEM